MFRNIWLKRKLWEVLICCLYICSLKFYKNSLNGILQPHSCCWIKWFKLAGTKFKYTSSQLTVDSFFTACRDRYDSCLRCSSKTILKCRFFPLVYCALQVTANWKRLKLEGRPLSPEGLETPRLCWFKKLNWLTNTRDCFMLVPTRFLANFIQSLSQLQIIWNPCV